jgi:hypothetical protein
MSNLCSLETNLKLEYSLSTLYAKDKNGKIKSWSAAVLSSKTTSLTSKPIAVLRLMHGYIDGKQQISYRDYIEGKNIGKKNETTPLIQCLNEAQRKWTDKKEKEGYNETLMLNVDSVCLEEENANVNVSLTFRTFHIFF